MYSSKPVVSIFDLKKSCYSRSCAVDCNAGITQEDIFYLNSLNQEELLSLQCELVQDWGMLPEEVTAYIEGLYDEAMDNLSTEEQIRLNDFVDQYIEMPKGMESLEILDAFQVDTSMVMVNDIYLTNALVIDNFARPLYKNLTSDEDFLVSRARPTTAECKAAYKNRMKISIIGCSWGGYLSTGPVGVGLAVFGFLSESITAKNDYWNCMRSR